MLAWRKARQQGARIPEDLWIAAAKLTRVNRPAKVANALGLGHYAVKERRATSMFFRFTAIEKFINSLYKPKIAPE